MSIKSSDIKIKQVQWLKKPHHKSKYTELEEDNVQSSLGNAGRGHNFLN